MKDYITKERFVVRPDNVLIVGKAMKNAERYDPKEIHKRALDVLLARGYSSEASAIHDLKSRNIIPETIPGFIVSTLISEIDINKLSDRLKHIRNKELKCSLSQLSTLINVTKSEISAKENGKRYSIESIAQYWVGLEKLLIKVQENPEILPPKVKRGRPSKEVTEVQQKEVDVVNENTVTVAEEPQDKLTEALLKIKSMSRPENLVSDEIGEMKAEIKKLKNAVELIACYIAREGIVS